MRVLDTDIDLILFALLVLLMVRAAEPPRQPPADVPMICIESVCYPAPLVSPWRKVDFVGDSGVAG